MGDVSGDSPVTRGGHKVDTSMDSGVWDLPLAGDEDLFPQVPLVLLIDVFDDRVPAEEEELGDAI